MASRWGLMLGLVGLACVVYRQDAEMRRTVTAMQQAQTTMEIRHGEKINDMEVRYGEKISDMERRHGEKISDMQQVQTAMERRHGEKIERSEKNL